MIEIEPPSVTQMWDLDGLSQLQMETATGIPWEHLRAVLEEAGFELSRASRFLAGPCVSCCRRHAVAVMTQDRRCRTCSPPPKGDLIVHGVNLTEERRKRAERDAERAAGIRPPLPDPCRIPTRPLAGPTRTRR